jgi:cytochrome c-type biogenesis protein
MGFTFGFGFTPCIGPVLGALLTLSSKSETLSSGVMYLVLFSLGLAVPFLSIALLSDRINLKNKVFINFQKYSTNISGFTLIALGYLIFADKIYILASFFQDILYLLNLEWLSTI